MSEIGDGPLFCRKELSNEYDEYAAAIVAIIIDQPLLLIKLLDMSLFS